jgi:hypothetical protein
MSKQIKVDFRMWRMFNTALLLYGLFGPWLKSCNTETNGFGFAKATPGVLLALFQKTAEFFKQDILSLLPILLADAILVYLVVNVLYLIFSIPDKNWHRISLAVALFAALITITAGIGVVKDGRDLLWGFWVTCAGLFSSTVMEVSERLKSNSSSSPDT